MDTGVATENSRQRSHRPYPGTGGYLVQVREPAEEDSEKDTSPADDGNRGCRASRLRRGGRVCDHRHRFDAPRTSAGAHLVPAPGSHDLTFWSQDVNGNVEAKKTVTFEVVANHAAPVTTASGADDGAWRTTSAYRGRTAKLSYRVDDALPSSGTATVVIKVKNSAGKVMKTLTVGVVNVNEAKTASSAFEPTRSGSHRAPRDDRRRPGAGCRSSPRGCPRRARRRCRCRARNRSFALRVSACFPGTQLGIEHQHKYMKGHGLHVGSRPERPSWHTNTGRIDR